MYPYTPLCVTLLLQIVPPRLRYPKIRRSRQRRYGHHWAGPGTSPLLSPPQRVSLLPHRPDSALAWVTAQASFHNPHSALTPNHPTPTATHHTPTAEMPHEPSDARPRADPRVPDAKRRHRARQPRVRHVQAPSAGPAEGPVPDRGEPRRCVSRRPLWARFSFLFFSFFQIFFGGDVVVVVAGAARVSRARVLRRCSGVAGDGARSAEATPWEPISVRSASCGTLRPCSGCRRRVGVETSVARRASRGNREPATISGATLFCPPAVVFLNLELPRRSAHAHVRRRGSGI